MIFTRLRRAARRARIATRPAIHSRSLCERGFRPAIAALTAAALATTIQVCDSTPAAAATRTPKTAPPPAARRPFPAHPANSAPAVELLTVGQAFETRIEMAPGDRAYLRQGWSSFEKFSFPDEGTLSICWATGTFSAVAIPRRQGLPTQLRFRVRTPFAGQTMRILWNGTAVDTVSLPTATWQTIELALPAAANPSGPDLLRFAYSIAKAQGSDTRPLAVLFDWIEITAQKGSIPSPRPYRRLGSQIQSRVHELSLPGSLTFRIARVPDDSRLSFAYSTTTNRDPAGSVDLTVSVASATHSEKSVLRETLSNIADRDRVAIAKIATEPPSEDAGAMSDGVFGHPWRASSSAPSTIRIDLREPTALTAFAIGSDEIDGRRRGIPARIEVALSGDGVHFDEPIQLDHAERPHHQWHVLPGTPVRALRLTIARTYDGQPAAIDEIVLSADHNLETLQNQLGRWRNESLDLSAFAGEDIEVTFSYSELSARKNVHQTRGLIAGPRIELPRNESDLNVVLISVDTVRADHLSAFGYERPTTPFLDRLIRQPGTVRFTNARSSSTWTPPSHLAMMVGQTPLHFHINATYRRFKDWQKNRRALVPLPPGYPTLASILRDHGYTTFAYSSAGGTMGELGLQNGFNTYDNPWNLLPSRSLDYFDELVSKTDRTARWLENHRDRKFFLFLHSYVAHLPYKAVGLAGCESSARNSERCSKYLDLLNRADNRLRRGGEWGAHRELLRQAGVYDAETMGALYDSGLLVMDAFLETIIADLDRLDLRRNTLVVITSDHGEPFAEHHKAHFDGGHGWSLYDEYLRIPLIFLVPGLEQAQQSAVPAALVDIAPTVLDFLQIPSPASFEGRSLTPAVYAKPHDLDRRPIFYEVLSTEQYEDHHFIAASRGSFKILANPYNLFDHHHALYDLASDPAERIDIAHREPEIALDLLSALDRHIADAFRGMIVVDISTLGRRGTTNVNGTIAFDHPVRLFEMAIRSKEDVAQPTEYGGDTVYEFNLDIDDERRIIGFRPTSPDTRIFLRNGSADRCTIRFGQPGRPADDDFVTVSTREIPAAALRLQATGTSGTCTIDLYAIESGDSGTPAAPSPAMSNQISDEDRERALEQMKALGYIK